MFLVNDMDGVVGRRRRRFLIGKTGVFAWFLRFDDHIVVDLDIIRMYFLLIRNVVNLHSLLGLFNTALRTDVNQFAILLHQEVLCLLLRVLHAPHHFRTLVLGNPRLLNSVRFVRVQLDVANQILGSAAVLQQHSTCIRVGLQLRKRTHSFLIRRSCWVHLGRTVVLLVGNEPAEHHVVISWHYSERLVFLIHDIPRLDETRPHGLRLELVLIQNVPHILLSIRRVLGVDGVSEIALRNLALQLYWLVAERVLVHVLLLLNQLLTKI